MDIFRIIYSWFYKIYNVHLFDYLKGLDCDGFFEGPDHFRTIGPNMIITSLLVAIIYYYVINHPRFNRWWSWLIMLFISAAINFTYGFSYVYNRLYGGQIDECFIEAANMSTGNCFSFGFTNALIGTIFFFIFSMIIKWWSDNSKYSPF